MNANEPAFPGEKGSINFAQGSTQHRGLSKRELFAGMAMQGVMACSLPMSRNGIPMEHKEPEAIAQCSVQIADALIAALKQPQPAAGQGG